MARKLYEDTLGRVLPTDLELLTLDQAMILFLPKNHLSTLVKLDPSELAAVIPADKLQPKSRCQIATEAAEARKAAQPDKQPRRRRRR